MAKQTFNAFFGFFRGLQASILLQENLSTFFEPELTFCTVFLFPNSLASFSISEDFKCLTHGTEKTDWITLTNQMSLSGFDMTTSPAFFYFIMIVLRESGSSLSVSFQVVD